MFLNDEETKTINRRSLLKTTGAMGITMVGASLLAGCGGSTDRSSSGSTDASILGAAKVAEALATTMYTAIINDAPFFQTLSADDQAYFTAARDEEKDHYDLLKSVTGNTDAGLTYYFPANMFTDLQTTINVLVTLEDAFIAAYLLGVKTFSTPALRVIAAQIMGIESDHRTLARIAGKDLGLTSTTGLSGVAETISPPNNNAYERTYGLDTLAKILAALGPFVDATQAQTAGYTVQKTFNPAYVPTTTLQGNPPA